MAIFQPMGTVSPLDAQLANLVQVAWILLIPVGVLLSLLLYKLALLLHMALEFGTIARYEVFPALKHLHRISGRVDVLTEKLNASVEQVEKTVEAVKPQFQKGAAGFRSVTSRLGKAAKTFGNGLVNLINKRTRS